MGFIICGKCGLPFTAKGLGAHARPCSGTRPLRPLEPIAGGQGGDGVGDRVNGQRGEPSDPDILQQQVRGDRPGGENSSPGFLPPLIAASRRSIMMSPALIPGSSTPGSAAA